MGNRISKNIVANTICKIWTALSSIVFVPIFISFLGEEAYGIVTFFAVMQTILNIMGVGLQKTLRREFARSNENDSNLVNRDKYFLLRSCEFVYFIICIIIICACSFGADFIANKWLHYENLDPQDVSLTISLMGACVGFQLISNLYIGCVFGLDLQGLSNLLIIIWVTIKNVGVVLILWVVSHSIVLFYFWNSFIDLIFCFVVRIIVIRLIPFKGQHRWTLGHLSNLKNIWKYALGLFIISLGSILNTQIDKVVMSKYLSIIDCGAYNTTYHLASFASYVPTIIGTAIFSNVANLIFQGEFNKAKTIFFSTNKKATIIVSVMSAFIAVFSYDILSVWTQSTTYANIMKTSAPLVIIGFALNAFQQVPYDFLLASGKTKLNEIQLICCIPYVLTVTVFLTREYGIQGASIAWVVEMLISTLLYLYFFYKISFGHGGLIWLLKDVLLVFVVSFLPAIITKTITLTLKFTPLHTVFWAMAMGCITLLLLFFTFDKVFLLKTIQQLYMKLERRKY